MEIKEAFKRAVTNNVKRPGVTDLLMWLETTDFYTAPASTRYHGAEPEGLVMHSLAVWNRLCELVAWYKLEVDRESVAIVALFHDLCKVDSYKVAMRNNKNEKTGQWEKVPYYTKKEDYAFGGHGSKSVYLVMNFMKLLPEEAAAINAHMGSWDSSPYNNAGDVYEQNMLAWLLHVADEAATYIDNT